MVAKGHGKIFGTLSLGKMLCIICMYVDIFAISIAVLSHPPSFSSIRHLLVMWNACRGIPMSNLANGLCVGYLVARPGGVVIVNIVVVLITCDHKHYSLYPRSYMLTNMQESCHMLCITDNRFDRAWLLSVYPCGVALPWRGV